jgi:L-ascorbate metabolism protein UlaG (beta-lactamase superfamily)
MLISVFTFVLISLALITLMGLLLSGPVYRGPESDHFDGRKFLNPGGIEAKGFKEVLRWMLNRKRKPWAKIQQPPGPRPSPFVDGSIRVTFVNHSSFLIQVDGLNILTDPVWSRRTSPFQWAGPKRFREPGIKFSDLPKIDVVLLSHNHYDHFDLPTVRKIYQLHQPRFIVPLGMNLHLAREKIKTGSQLDWWEEIAISDTVSIKSVPAQHFSGRGTIDRDRTLWCGYVINTSRGNIYFAGDTGYNRTTFVELGARFGKIALALIPIGAYKPVWFMSPIHCTPEEAVIIHKEVNATQSIATHFGTFPLADDSQADPINDLKIALGKHNVSPENFLILSEGAPYDLK